MQTWKINDREHIGKHKVTEPFEPTLIYAGDWEWDECGGEAERLSEGVWDADRLGL